MKNPFKIFKPHQALKEIDQRKEHKIAQLQKRQVERFAELEHTLESIMSNIQIKDGQFCFNLGDFRSRNIWSTQEFQIILCEGCNGNTAKMYSHIDSNVSIQLIDGSLTVNTEQGTFDMEDFASLHIPAPIAFSIEARSKTTFVYITKPPEQLFNTQES